MAKFLRPLAVVAGVLLVVGGLPLLASPVPVGLVMIVLGLVILAAASPHAQKFIRAERDLHPRLDQRLARAEKKMPEATRKPLEKTHPGHD
jgi:hypothetical protein